eukprot:s4306_g6.t2
MQAGEIVYLRYHGDPGVIHTRLLIGCVQDDEWMIVTPNEDIYVEELARHNPDLQYMWHAPDGRLARGVPASQAYGFAPMTAAQYAEEGGLSWTLSLAGVGWESELWRLASAQLPPSLLLELLEWGQWWLHPWRLPRLWHSAGRSPNRCTCGGCSKWRARSSRSLRTRLAAESSDSVSYGEVVAGVAAPAVEGGKIVHRMPDGSELFCMCINESRRQGFNDGRILGRGFHTLGGRGRSAGDFKSSLSRWGRTSCAQGHFSFAGARCPGHWWLWRQTPPLVASYEPSLLSLPTGEVPPLPLHELLGADGMKVVEDFVSTRLLQRNDALRNLHRTGLAFGRITDEEPVEKVEVFFVRKRDGRLHMVVDCRRSSQWFAAPDKINLATAEPDMSLSVDQLLAESSSDEEGPASSKDGALGDKQEAKKEGACASRTPTLAEALAQADFSEDEEELGPQQRDPAAANLGPEGSSRLGTVPSEGRGDDASDGSQAKTGQMVGLDELLAMDSETSSEGAKSQEAQPRQLAAETEDGAAPPERLIATSKISGEKDQMEEFLEAPFTWSSEHERSLLFAPGAAHGHSADFNDLGPGERATVAASAAEVRSPQLVEVKPSSELRRQLAQEIGLPTCVAASSKVVAVGTLRGSVALLDQRLQDLSPKPQVLTLGEETSAVTAAAFSQDGGSLLVGHKGGHVVLWDLAAPKIACMVQELHSSAVISLAFCRPSWQYALSADAKGCVYFVTFFTGTFGRLDFEKQLLIEQSSNIGVTLRVLPLLQVSTQNHPADARCLVGLCASNATVLLTLHPSAQVVQKMQYNAKDASWVPDAAWLRRESQEIAEPSQGDCADPQLCVAYGQTIHLMRVVHAEREGKEEFQVSVVGRFSWGSPLRGLIAFTDSVLAILDASGRHGMLRNFGKRRVPTWYASPDSHASVSN